MRPFRQNNFRLVRDRRLHISGIGIGLNVSRQQRVRRLRADARQVDEQPIIEARLAGREGGICSAANFSLRRPQANHPSDFGLRGLLIADPTLGRVVAFRRDPASVYKDSPPVRKPQRGEQVVTVQALIFLVAQCCLVCKVVDPAYNDSAVFHCSKVGFRLGVQVKRIESAYGQYLSVKVASDAIRSYSIATRNGKSNFDLLVDTRPGGPGSKFFENLKVGDKIAYLGPFGIFTFKEDDKADELLFLATGSGISATRCMIDVALLENNFKKPITLYFGLTTSEEIFWKDHFEELSKRYPNFKYKIALFKPDESWKGATGFITELVKNDYPDAGKCAAYLCGHRAMISDAADLLLKNGCPKDRIYTERFI